MTRVGGGGGANSPSRSHSALEADPRNNCVKLALISRVNVRFMP